jgi:hypothetical protein
MAATRRVGRFGTTRPAFPTIQASSGRTRSVGAEGLDRYPRTASGQLARTGRIAAGRLGKFTWTLQSHEVGVVSLKLLREARLPH